MMINEYKIFMLVRLSVVNACKVLPSNAMNKYNKLPIMMAYCGHPTERGREMLTDSLPASLPVCLKGETIQRIEQMSQRWVVMTIELPHFYFIQPINPNSSYAGEEAACVVWSVWHH